MRPILGFAPMLNDQLFVIKDRIPSVEIICYFHVEKNDFLRITILLPFVQNMVLTSQNLCENLPPHLFLDSHLLQTFTTLIPYFNSSYFLSPLLFTPPSFLHSL